MVNGSVGARPKSSVATNRLAPKAPASPMATPTVTIVIDSRIAKAVVLDVAYDADDFLLRAVLDEIAEPFADRIVSGEVLPRRGFVDDNHTRRLVVVAVGQQTTRQQRDAHCRKEARRHRHLIHVAAARSGRFVRADGGVRIVVAFDEDVARTGAA